MDIFFVLSGYLISTLLIREFAESGGVRFRRFYLRRLIRLYPALILALVVLALPGFLFAPSALKYLIENLLALTYLTPFALQVSDGAAWAWRHTWSLGIEEAFYLVWPIVLVIAIRTVGRRALMVLLGMIGLTILSIGVYSDLADVVPSLFIRTGGLFVGACLALYLHHRPAGYSSPVIGWLGVFSIVLSVLSPMWVDLPESAVVLTVLGSSALVAHLVGSRRSLLSRFLSLSPLTYIGRISYELYLWHFPMLVIVAWALSSELRDVAFVAVPMAVVCSVASHHVLAGRVDVWKKRISSPRTSGRHFA